MTPRSDDMRHFLNAGSVAAQFAETVKSTVRARSHSVGNSACVSFLDSEIETRVSLRPLAERGGSCPPPPSCFPPAAALPRQS